ncbi:MAG TPA: NAD(P)H-quinone oxidoreductase [Microthrixaceae bacterium]|nr:NAD(P)H-quinone oxidoreductase [Microthrixaceae bacterium]
MRAVVLDTYGGTDVLGLRDIPSPVLGPDEVLVDVVATALNRADLLQRQGLYPGPSVLDANGNAYEVPGMEFSGTVAAVGARVTGAKVGDPVMGIVGGGSYAEQLVTHERLLMPVPASVALADAAAIPEVFVTAFDALVAQGGLTTGRTALVHAGASGVGTAAIQIAKAIGARIVVTTSTGKVERCRELGADVVVDYTTDDFVAASKEATGGRGVDVVLDVIGGEYLARNLGSVGTGGRIIQVGVMGGGPAEVNLGVVLMKKAQIIGTTLRSRPIEEKIAICRRFVTEVLPWFDLGALRPVIDRRYPLADIAAAHDYLAENTSVGKVLIDVMR